MRQAPPLVPLAAVVCAGIVLAEYSRVPFWLFWTAVLAFLGLSAAFIKKRVGLIFLLLAAFFTGASLLRISRQLPADHIAQFTPPRGIPVYVEGVVASDPVEQKRCVSFIIQARGLKTGAVWRDVSGKVLVKVYEKREFFYGEKLLLEGKLYQVPEFSISERLNYRDYLQRKQIYSILSVKKGSAIKLQATNQGNLLKACAFRAKHRMGQVIDSHLSPLSAKMLSAIVLGERRQLDPSLKKALSSTGTIHVIAISGLHLGIVTFIALILFKVMRIPRTLRYALTVFLLIIYCFLTGARVPVIRATIMVGVLLSGLILKREIDVANSLAAAALLILFANPGVLFEASFQLSFVSIVSLVYLSPKIMLLFPQKLIRIRYARIFITVFSASSAVWLGLLPLIAYYFRIVSPIAVLANMLVVPYMTVVIACGFTFALAGTFSSLLASIFSASSELSLAFLLKLILSLAKMPGAYFHLPVSFPFWAVLLYYYVLFAGFGLVSFVDSNGDLE